MEPTVIYLVDRRRKLLTRYEAVQQGAAAVVLIIAGAGIYNESTQTTESSEPFANDRPAR